MTTSLYIYDVIRGLGIPTVHLREYTWEYTYVDIKCNVECNVKGIVV